MAAIARYDCSCFRPLPPGTTAARSHASTALTYFTGATTSACAGGVTPGLRPARRSPPPRPPAAIPTEGRRGC